MHWVKKLSYPMMGLSLKCPGQEGGLTHFNLWPIDHPVAYHARIYPWPKEWPPFTKRVNLRTCNIITVVTSITTVTIIIIIFIITTIMAAGVSFLTDSPQYKVDHYSVWSTTPFPIIQLHAGKIYSATENLFSFTPSRQRNRLIFLFMYSVLSFIQLVQK